MILGLLQSFALGFAVSAAPGAVFFETIRRTIAQRTSVTYFLLGNFTGIVCIASLVFLGFSAVTLDGTTESVFYGLSGLVLLWIGLSAVLAKPQQKPATHIASKAMKHGNAKGFTIGFVLATANPIAILFWISIIGTYMSEMTPQAALLNGLAVLLGAVALFLLLVIAVNRIKKGLSDTFLLWLSRIFGGIIVAYGFSMLLRIL